MTSQAKGRAKLLDVAALGEEYGPNRFFWRDVIARGLIPTIRPPAFRRVFVRRSDVETLLDQWTEQAEGGS